MKILFVCRANVARSQMAEEFFKRMTKKHKTESAGTEAKDKGKMIGSISPVCARVMIEEGIDIEKKRPRKITLKMVKGADILVLITKEGIMPDYISKTKRLIFWDVKDPKGENLKAFRSAREDVKKRVRELVTEIG